MLFLVFPVVVEKLRLEVDQGLNDLVSLCNVLLELLKNWMFMSNGKVRTPARFLPIVACLWIMSHQIVAIKSEWGIYACIDAKNGRRTVECWASLTSLHFNFVLNPKVLSIVTVVVSFKLFRVSWKPNNWSRFWVSVTQLRTNSWHSPTQCIKHCKVEVQKPFSTAESRGQGRGTWIAFFICNKQIGCNSTFASEDFRFEHGAPNLILSRAPSKVLTPLGWNDFYVFTCNWTKSLLPKAHA